jgi:hyaluronan synthase
MPAVAQPPGHAGAPCTFGEDRGMTNLLLEAGFDTVYQRTAVVRTIVP